MCLNFTKVTSKRFINYISVTSKVVTNKMTNEKQETLEERTKIRLNDIEDIMKDARITFTNISWSNSSTQFQSLYKQNLALYEQNEIIIDYLQEIYKTQKGEQKW